MELPRLIDGLSQDDAYPHAVERVEVCQTHISVVFLAGEFVYKIKKPVDLGFLDFTTLELRRHFCAEEVRLNRRLAPDVYLGVVAVNQSGERISFEGSGETVEWAVKMQRLPAEATLLRRLERDEVDAAVVEKLAQRIAAFHAQAESGPHIAAFGRFDIVAGNARENFEQAAAHVGLSVSPAVFARVRSLTEELLARLRALIEGRAERGIPRDTHGDLHLDHVYLFPDRPPPGDLVVIDCIEFSERFRYADPVADMAFLVMDLERHGRRDLARVCADVYFQAGGDKEGQDLLTFYSAYRAVVRAKVEGFKSIEKEVPDAERQRARAKAKALWLLALVELETPRRRPCLVLVGGLPGSGKSTLARGLGEQASLDVIRSDVVRKELAGVPAPDAPAGAAAYTSEWTDRTYAECLMRAERIVFEGGRALVDASFIDESRRRCFLDAAARWSVPAVLFVCHVDPDTARARLQKRRGDASDADWSIRQLAAERWEEFGPRTQPIVCEISTHGSPRDALERALAHLHELELHD